MGLIVVILVLVFVFEIVSGLHGARFRFKKFIKVDAFMRQIETLIAANNLDRAIKLCNAEPEATLAKAVKKLLVRANRPYSLELVYQEVRKEFSYFSDKGWGFLAAIVWSHSVSGLLVIACIFGLISVLQHAEWSVMAVGWGIIPILIVRGMNIWVAGTRVKYYRESEQALLKLRNSLYLRSSYIPAHIRPRKEEEVSEEELKAWRESLGVLEKTAEKKHIQAVKIYEKTANKESGILPPI